MQNPTQDYFYIRYIWQLRTELYLSVRYICRHTDGTVDPYISVHYLLGKGLE